MTNLAVGEQVCKSAIWERIEGWEVVTAVFLIVAGWSAIQVARLYYFAAVARIGNEPPTKDDS